MDHERVERWEEELTPEQREKLRALRASKCRVEAVFVPAEEVMRLSVTDGHLLLAARNEEHDIRAAFDLVYTEVMSRLTLPNKPAHPTLN